MARKYIEVTAAGALAEVEGLVTSAGAGDAGKFPALDSTGRLDTTVMPVGVGQDAASIQASENLTAGDFVNLHNSGGARVRKADASNGREAHGFVLAAATTGNNATVFFEGRNTALSSLSPGARYFLSGTTAGAATATAPTTSGQIVQPVGVAVSATEIDFEKCLPVTRA